MADLYAAAAIIAAASAALFALGLTLGRRLRPRAAAGAALAACAFIVAFVGFADDHPLLARVLPFSGVVILGDWLTPAVALLGGLAWRGVPGGTWRKCVVVVPLLALCAYRPARWMAGAPPPLDDRWKGGVCRQTSQASCSAAAAATLLRAHGFETSEPEMAGLCLTRPNGTPTLGLYRGLKLKTRGSSWTVETFRGDIDSLRREPRPVILSVRLDPGPAVDDRYERLWGWAPGVKHTVVFFGFRDDGKTEVGDPAVGREHWRVDDLRVLWHGEGFRLVRAQTAPRGEP